MTKLAFGAVALSVIHVLIARHGSADAAIWLTGSIGCFALVCYGLARA